MDTTIIVAIITVSGSIVIAGLTFYLTKRHQLKVEWQHEKLNHYKDLVSSLSDLAVDGTDKNKASMEAARASNTIALVASQDVIEALMDFWNEVKPSNLNKSSKKHDELLIKLLLAIRRDIGLAKKDDMETFKFHFIGASASGLLQDR